MPVDVSRVYACADQKADVGKEGAKNWKAARLTCAFLNVSIYVPSCESTLTDQSKS